MDDESALLARDLLSLDPISRNEIMCNLARRSMPALVAVFEAWTDDQLAEFLRPYPDIDQRRILRDWIPRERHAEVLRALRSK